VEKPVKNVRQKAGLNRTIGDQAWGVFVKMLRYKVAWRGGLLVEVPVTHQPAVPQLRVHSRDEPRVTKPPWLHQPGELHCKESVKRVPKAAWSPPEIEIYKISFELTNTGPSI
jgi:hypothetical protein